MSVTLASDNYGKSGIRLVKVVRDGSRHHLHDYTVAVKCEGNFDAAHVDGDNSAVLPTDTMKNTVYAFARLHDVAPPERFAALLAAHFLAASAQATRVTVDVAVHGWHRLDVAGRAHDTAFERGSDEARLCSVADSRGAGAVVHAGISDLMVLRTAGSAFAGYPRDPYTTLKETRDRIFATAVSARWRYDRAVADPDAAFAAVREALVATFANHPSESVQHTLYAMGAAALAAIGAIAEIRLSLPNKHHLLVDLTPLNLDNPNEVFVATTEPYGLIEATLTR